MEPKEDVKLMSMDDIMNADDVKYKVIDAFGGKVRIGSLNAGDMIEFIESNEGPAKKTAGVRLIIKSLVDKDGVRIGTEKHLQGMLKRNAEAVNRVVGEILELNGMGEAAKKLKGNASSEANSDASPTA